MEPVSAKLGTPWSAPVPTRLGTPWSIDVARLRTLFAGDPEIRVTDDIIDDNTDETNETTYTCTITVANNPIKAMAIGAILVKQFTYGKVKLDVIIEDNRDSDCANLKFFEAAFTGNPNFVKSIVGVDTFGHLWPFVVMDKTIAQYSAGDTSDFYGNRNEVMADLTRELTRSTDLGLLVCTYDPDYQPKVTVSTDSNHDSDQ